eukprot:gene7369-7579_t
MASPQTLHNNSNNGFGLQQSPAAFNKHPSPVAVTSVMHTAAAGAANAHGSSCFSPARPQLGSLLLVASKLAGAGGSSDVIGSQGLMASSSRFLPATLATLQATTASVVAAEVLAAAMNTKGLEVNARAFDVNPGLLPSNFVSKDLVAACHTSGLKQQLGVLDLPAVKVAAAAAVLNACLVTEGQQAEGLGHADSSSCTGTPKAAGAAAGVPGSVDGGTVAAAARLLHAMGGLHGEIEGDDGGMGEPGCAGDSEARVGSNFVEMSRQRFVGKAAGAGSCGLPGQEAVAAMAASAAADVVVTVDRAGHKQQEFGLVTGEQDSKQLAVTKAVEASCRHEVNPCSRRLEIA